jgi:hypothetical protein
MTVCGSRARVRKRLADYQQAGVDAVIVGLAAPSHQAKIDQIELIRDLA